MKAAIIGGGLQGVRTAYYLGKAGIGVTVLERHDGPALEASFGNAGYLQAERPETWNQPGIQGALPQWWWSSLGRNRKDAAKLLRTAELLRLVPWGVRLEGLSAGFTQFTNMDWKHWPPGARGSVPDIPGADLPCVFDSHAALNAPEQLGQDVVIAALEDHMQPLAVARRLSTVGKRVRLIDQTHAIAPLVGKYSIGATLSKLSTAGVTVNLMERVRSVMPDRLALRHVYSGVDSQLTGFDSVVFSTGGQANDELFHQIKERHPQVHLLGDAYAPRRIWFATRQAHKVAQVIWPGARPCVLRSFVGLATAVGHSRPAMIINAHTRAEPQRYHARIRFLNRIERKALSSAAKA